MIAETRDFLASSLTGVHDGGTFLHLNFDPVYRQRDHAIPLFCHCRRTAGSNTIFDFMTEMLDQPLNGPGRRITKGADGMPLNLPGDLLKHIDFADIGITAHQTVHHPVHPARAFTAWSTLTA